jgi:hypothetical protein
MLSRQPNTHPCHRPEMALRGRIGGYAKAARYPPSELTAPARTAFLERFLDLVDPDRVLPEAERRRRADAALKAHMARLAYRSAKARQGRKGCKK